MISIITGFAVKYAVELAVGAVGSALLGYILAKIPTGKWAKQSGEAGIKHAKAFNAFAIAKIPLWEKLIEPVFIDTITVLTSYISGFIIGLKANNK